MISYSRFEHYSEDDLSRKLLRIGSVEYEALPLVRKYTLDQKVRDVMDGPATYSGDAS